ncbi:MAG: tryptophan synthase subunit alpha [Spirochaetales bacterium]|jgi:tryptophan synthase alpha chain|nr:tryptophan synthase subunit alpha [Spirochaetales bacterium]
MKNRLMCHLVAGYPSGELSFSVCEALAEAGAAYLEIQFPFSDPASDGPDIQNACTRSLAAGFSVKEGFGLVERCAARFPAVPVFIMTYGSLVVRPGVEAFLLKAKNAGASGLIVPDLPWDYDEGLYAAGEKTGISVAPVLVPGTSEDRIRRILGLRPAFLYAALRTGITGSRTELGPENLAFLDKLKGEKTKILAGFGISSKEQVDALMPHAEAAVAGSHFVRIIAKHGEAGAARLKAKLADAVKALL